MFYHHPLSLLGMVAESEEILLPVVCYRHGHETGGLDLEDHGRGGDLQLSYLLHWLEWPAGS